MQAFAVVHETPAREFIEAPARFRGARIAQLVPFHDSARVDMLGPATSE